MRFLPRLLGGSREITHVSPATETDIPDRAGQKIIKWGTAIVVALSVALSVIVLRFDGVDAAIEFAIEWWHVPVILWLILWPVAGVVIICRMISEIWYKNHPTHAQLNSSRLMGPFGWSKEQHDAYDRAMAAAAARILKEMDDADG